MGSVGDGLFPVDAFWDYGGGVELAAEPGLKFLQNPYSDLSKKKTYISKRTRLDPRVDRGISTVGMYGGQGFLSFYRCWLG